VCPPHPRLTWAPLAVSDSGDQERGPRVEWPTCEGAPTIIGWDLEVFVQSVASGAQLEGSLTLQRGFKGGGGDASGVISGWSVNSGGVLFVPAAAFWVDLVDVGAADAGNESLVLFAATAVYAGENAKGSSLLYGWDRGSVGASSTVDFSVPRGATGYLVRPAEAISSDLRVLERTAGVAMSFYALDISTVSAVAGKASGFISTPDGPSPDVQVTNTDGASAKIVSVRWKWDLRSLR